ncbi:bacteriocin-like protein [Elizabethkingia meningoseptica]|uniref:bacteriocin-like protein n=1 Tax=Elizabethkingia meningoseptica TaxID=238 RepID=UPI003BAB8365
MKNFKKISRNNLKEITGGGGYYQCCWNNANGPCSQIAWINNPGADSCVSGAHLVQLS